MVDEIETLLLNIGGTPTVLEFTKKEIEAKQIVALKFLDEIITTDYSFKNWVSWTNDWIASQRCLAWEFWKDYFSGKNKDVIVKEDNPYEIFGIRGQVEHFYKLQPFFYDSIGMFHLWEKDLGKWSSCDKVDMLNVLQKNIPGVDTINAKMKNEIISALEQVGRNKKPKDIPKTWIQFKDKIVDILTGEEFNASPEYYTTNPISWNIGDSNETPTIDKLIREWVVDSDYQNETYIKTMKQIIAYTICSDQFMQRMVALCGAGLNGKGTFVKLLTKFIGIENTCASDLRILSTNNFEASSLYKKLLCIMGEVDTTDLKNTNTIKKLSGEDTMRFEFKGKGSFTDESITTCIIQTNSLPTTPDKSLGFYRRWLIIDFPHQFTVKRDLIGQIPDIEFENLGRCCLELLKEMYESNKFENEGELNDRMNRYEERSNPLLRFIESECVEEMGNKISVKEFCNEFNKYLKNKHLRIQNPKIIKKSMKDEGFEDTPRKILVGAEVLSIRCFLNIKLRTTETTETTENQSQNTRGETSLESCSFGSFCSLEDFQ